MQRVRNQLHRAQDTVQMQEQELERLRKLRDELGDSLRERQVRQTVGQDEWGDSTRTVLSSWY